MEDLFGWFASITSVGASVSITVVGVGSIRVRFGDDDAELFDSFVEYCCYMHYNYSFPDDTELFPRDVIVSFA